MNLLSKLLLVSGVVLFAGTGVNAKELVVWEDLNKDNGIAKAVEDFQKEYNCTVRVTNSDYVSHVNEYEKMLNSGTKNLPDILMLPADRLGASAQKGLIQPLRFMSSDSSLYLDKSIDAFTYNGQIYACPRSVETMVVFYNQDLLKYPLETMEDYYNFSAAKKMEGKWGVIGKWDFMYFIYGFIRGNGGYVFGKDGAGNYNPHDIGLNNAGAIKGLEYLNKFVQNVVPVSVLGPDGFGHINSLFTSGKAAAVITGPWEFNGYAKSGINYGVAPLPKLPNGNYMCPFLGFRGYVVSKSCKDRDLAEKFLRFINQEKYALNRYEQIQELPPLKAVFKNPLIENDDFANAIAVQAQNAEPMPSIPEMGSVWGPMDKAIGKVLSKKATAKDALDEAVAEIKASIE